jgi:GNAT superfamily N-acetyltransferase
MAFWKDYAVPSWWESWISKEAEVLQSRQALFRPVEPIPGIHPLRPCLPADADDITRLLRAHFTVGARCRMELPSARICGGLQAGWIGVCARDLSHNRLIGCAFSLPAEFEGRPCGIVDFFCVEPTWRKRGVARSLLRSLVNQTAAADRLVHFFLKEGFPLLSLPPLYQGRWMWRRSAGNQKISCPPGFCFQDLYHRSLPEGHRLGELVEYPRGASAQQIEEVIDNSSYEIVCMDTRSPHILGKGWKNDITYQWYCFNFHPGSFFATKPPVFRLR